MFKYIVISILLLSAVGAVAQQKADTLLVRLVDQAAQFNAVGKYAEAQQVFKKVFASKNVVLPDASLYHYGVTLFHIGQYRQGKSAIQKYLKLTDTSGLFYDASLKLLRELDCAETGYRDAEELCDICFGDTLKITCRRCKGKGRELCPACQGKGVVITENGMGGRTFKDCERCKGEKTVLCLTCKGERKETTVCFNCGGKGKVKARKKCP